MIGYRNNRYGRLSRYGGFAKTKQDYFAAVKGENSYREQAKEFGQFRIFLDESMPDQDEIRMFAHFIYCRLHHYKKST